MSDSPNDPMMNGGWHAPENPDAWRRIAKPSPKRSRATQTPTLPTSLQRSPTTAGAWHLPAPTDTLVRAISGPRPEDEVLPDVARPEDTAPPPEDAVPAAPRPEDAMPAAPRPEDVIPAAPRPEDEILPDVPRPEDEILSLAPEDEAEAVDDDLALDELDLEDLTDDYEDALIDLEEDDDAFQMSELMALQSLADEEGDLDDEAPAAEAAPSSSDYIQQQLAALEAEDDGETGDQLAETQPQPGGFDYASQIAALEGGDTPQQDDPAFGADATTADSFSYTDMINQLEGGDTQSFDQTPSMPPVDPEREQLAQTFAEREQQIRALRQQRDVGMITQQQLESQLRELMVLDNDNNWWMMGVDTEIWYRYNPVSGQWEVAEPPRPANQQGRSAVPTETGVLDPNEVIQGSLPQLGQEGSYTAPQGLGNTAGYTPETDYVTPGPAGQYDEQATMVGTSAFREVLPGSEPTVVNDAVDIGEDEGEYVPPGGSIESPIEDDAAFAPEYEGADAEGERVRRAKERQRRSTLTQLLVAAAVIFGIVLISGAAVILGGTVWYRNIAERWTDPIAQFGNFQTEFQTVEILDVENNVLARLRSEAGGNRTSIPLAQVAPVTIHAVVSTENERFFTDPGFDLIAISRAFLQNLGGGEVVSGGSTITQQLARRIVFDGAQFANEADRKLNEVVVAAEISRLYSKEEILETYLNEVYFGNQAYGIEAAADFYFEKDAADLNLAESALIAGLIQAPAANDPVSNPEAAFARMDEVLNLMVRVGCLPIPNNAAELCITRDTLRGEAAVQVAQVKTRRYLPDEAGLGDYPHFVIFVQELLQQQFTTDEIYRRGFRVRTTLNPRLQDAAQQALIDRLAGLTTTGVNTGTVMITDPRTGAIRAMVGSPDFDDETIDGQVNIALTYQQPGSAIKPVTYTAALNGVVTEAGPRWYTPASILWDVPTTYPDGTPIRNFDNEYHGPVSVRSALQNSYNIPAVKAYAFIGEQNFIQMANAMGLRFPEGAIFGFPTAVGATEVRLYDMMEAYGTLANDGALTPLYAIEEITDFQGNPVPWENPEPVQAVPPPVAYLMQNIMSDDAARAPEFGPNTILQFAEFPGAVAAKTGTSSGNRDLWTMGYTNNAVVGVWLGRVDNGETFGTSGYLTAAPVWNQVMRAVLSTVANPGPFEPVGGVVNRQICSTTGALADPNNPSCPGNVVNALVLDNQPPPSEGFIRDIQIDSWNQLIANQFCPNNVITVTVANIDDPTAVAWLNNEIAGRNYAASIGLPIPLPQPPGAACDQNTPILQAGINSPAQGSLINTALVPIEGAIGNISNFASYDLQIAPASSPTNFQIVAGPFNQIPIGSRLGEWDASNAPDGQYILRLALNSTTGGFAYRTTEFTLDKPEPTPTPTPLPVPTTPPIGSTTGGTTGGGLAPTPIPFDTPIPFGSTTGGTGGDLEQDFRP